MFSQGTGSQPMAGDPSSAQAQSQFALQDLIHGKPSQAGSTSQSRAKQGFRVGPARQARHDQEEVSDDEECGDTDEHIIHSAAPFNPSGMMSASDSGATSSQMTYTAPGQHPSDAQDGKQQHFNQNDLQPLDEVEEQEDDSPNQAALMGGGYGGDDEPVQFNEMPRDMLMVNPSKQKLHPTQIAGGYQGPQAQKMWDENAANVYDDEIADEAEDDDDDDDQQYANNSHSGGSLVGGQPQNFNLAYKNLVQQMLNAGPQLGGNVLVPTEDYHLAEAEERRVDLTRIQDDLERRRARQEARELEARAQRDAKELEGCTFAPTINKKKKRITATPGEHTATVMLSPEQVDDEFEEPQAFQAQEEDQRDISQFLLDQQRYEEEKRKRKERIQLQREEEINKMQGPKMNANSRRILERKQRNEPEGGNAAKEDEQSKAAIPARRIERITVKASTRKTTKSVPTGSVQLTKKEDGTSFAPQINRRSVALAATKREGRVEDHLLRQGELQRKKKADREAKSTPVQSIQLAKLSDKYILQRFTREFERVIQVINLPQATAEGDEQQTDEPEADLQAAMKAPLNYLRFKEFLIEMCFMTEQQAMSDSTENNLAFELWELVAPKVSRDLLIAQSHNGDEEEESEKAYINEMQAQEVTLVDLRVLVMAILRLNDGKLFINASDAPLQQSENEIGFRREDGQFCLRVEELPSVHKTFELFYTNRLQLQSQRQEQQKQIKQQIEEQRKIEEAKPVLSSKTDEFAARYRAKQINKARNNSVTKKDQIRELVEGNTELDTFEWLSKQPTKATSVWQEEAKKAKDARELSECTFAPTLTARKTVGKASEAPANERLYNMRRSQRDKTDKAKVDYEFEKQAEECTFAPNLNRKPARTKKQSEAARLASERQQKTMQKQLERMNKAREEKERVKRMTERGIPKSSKPAMATSTMAQQRQTVVNDANDSIIGEKQVETPAAVNQRLAAQRASLRQTPANVGFLRGNSANKGSMIGSGTGGISAAAMAMRSKKMSSTIANQQLPAKPYQLGSVRIEGEEQTADVRGNEDFTGDQSGEDNLLNLEMMPLQKEQSEAAMSSVGEETALELPSRQPSEPETAASQGQGHFEVGVSGGNIAAQNATSTMFAQRHTQSILSDETIEPHLLLQRDQSHVAPSEVIVEEVATANSESLQGTKPEAAAELGVDQYESGTLETVHCDGENELPLETQEALQQITIQESVQETQQNQYIDDLQEEAEGEEQYEQHLPETILDADADDIEDQGEEEEKQLYGQELIADQEEDEDEDDDFDDSNPPLLFVDVNLGANEQQRIVVYEGDTAQELAEKFCQEHDLDDETQKNLEALLEQQISSVLTKIDENEEDAESYTSN